MLTSLIPAAGMLITGTINTVAKKLQNNSKGVDTHGDRDFFHYPWFQTLCMFTGETLCLLFLLFFRMRAKRSKNLDDPILHLPKLKIPYFILTTCLDLIGTSLSGIGLLYTNASVFQMLRGSLIVFVALLRIIFLKRKMKPFHFVGLSSVIFSLFLVGYSSILDSGTTDASSSEMLFGNIIIVVGMFFNAVQFVTEEIFVQGVGYHPFQIVGTEGVIGVLVTGLIILPTMYFIPGDQHGHYENTLDAFHMFKTNNMLIFYASLYTCSIAFYNAFGLIVTRVLSAVNRTLLDAVRTILVWLMMLLFYYAGSSMGEEWGAHTYLELIGFVFLVSGTFVYYDIIRLPIKCLYPASEEERPLLKAEADGAAAGETPTTAAAEPGSTPKVINN